MVISAAPSGPIAAANVRALHIVWLSAGASAISAWRVALPHGIPLGDLADANESRDWRIYRFRPVLIRIARPLYARGGISAGLDHRVPWAKFRRHKAAVKMQAGPWLPTARTRQHSTIGPEPGGMEPTSISNASGPSARRSSSCEPRRTSCSNGATRIPSTGPRACARIRPSSWAPSNRPKRIRTRCGGSATSTPRSGCSS